MRAGAATTTATSTSTMASTVPESTATRPPPPLPVAAYPETEIKPAAATATAYGTPVYYSSDDDETDSIPERTTTYQIHQQHRLHQHQHQHEHQRHHSVEGDTDSDWGGSSDDGRMGRTYEEDITEEEEDIGTLTEDDDYDDENEDDDAAEILMSEADIEICQRLDYEYELALEEREIAYTARYQSVRQSAFLSIVFMLLFLTLASMFFLQQAEDWNVSDSVLFSIYTITTVGYGHLEHPETTAFQLYIIFFIFIGIATLTIMVAQVYQCLALEASRAQHSRDHKLFTGDVITRHGTLVGGHRSTPHLDVTPPSAASTTTTATSDPSNTSNGNQPPQAQQQQDPQSPSLSRMSNMFSMVSLQQFNNLEIVQQHSHWVDLVWHWYDSCRSFFSQNEIGRSLSVLFPFLGLIGIGALVIGPIEGWGVVESLYFSVVSLTTVGFGDYYPTRTASICFCILWLPCSVGFMSLFLANVAAFYIRLSDKNIARIERNLRQHVARAKAQAERELQEARRRALRGQEMQQQQQAEMMTESSSSLSATTNPESSNKNGSGSIELPAVRVPRVGGGSQKRRGFDTIPTTEEEAHHYENDDDDMDVHNHRASAAAAQQEDVEAVAVAQSHPLQHNVITTTDLFGSSKRSPRNRREMILRNSRRARQFSQLGNRGASRVRDTSNNSKPLAATIAPPDDKSTTTTSSGNRPSQPTMATMRDVLRTVRRQMASDGGIGAMAGPESEFLSIRSTRTVRHRLESYSASSNATTTLRKPSFALRALVQERFSEIIATEVAGYSSNIEIHDNTLTVTIDSMRQTADKWLIPRRARKAFRAVCFETLFFVGEHSLIVRGADALYDLTPIEFHGIFAPLLAAMADAETMEGWLASTEVLAEVDLKHDALQRQYRRRRRAPKMPTSSSGHSPQRREVVVRPGETQSQASLPNSNITGHSTSKPAKQLTTPGTAFAAANRSMQYA